MAQEIDYDLEFDWWVKAVLKKILRIIYLVKKKERSIPEEDT